MNTQAFNDIKNKSKSQEIYNERIGELDFLSSYTPFYNGKNELLGYLNIPYFANQYKLQNGGRPEPHSILLPTPLSDSDKCFQQEQQKPMPQIQMRQSHHHDQA